MPISIVGGIITGIASFVGIITGAALQYIFTRHLDTQRHRRDLRTKAYIGYLKAVSKQSNVDTQNRNSLIRAQVADAKFRVCLYGSRAVIRSFSKFEEAGANINKNPIEFTKMVTTMRNDSTEEKADSEDIQRILIG